MPLGASRAFALSCLAVISCALTAAQAQTAPVQLIYDFCDGSLGWHAGYADYTPANEESYELRAELRTLPAEIAPGGTGFYIQGHNRSP